MGDFDMGKLLSASVGKVSVGDILTALIVLAVCLMAVRLLMKLARRLLSASKLDGRVQKYLLSGVRLVLYLLSAIIVMESLNIDMTSLVALLSVASLGVTLAAEDVLANVAGGLVILFSKPFQIGDYIETDQCAGTVVSIDLIHTKLDTFNGQRVMMPNSALSGFRWEWGVIGLLLVPVLATAIQYVSTIILAKSNGQSAEQQKSMRMVNLLMPLMSLWFCFSMPAGLGVYWIANSLWMMIRESLLGKFYTKKLNEEEEEREAKRAAARQLRMEEAKKKAAEQRELEPKKPKKQPQKPPEKKISTNEAGRIGERPYARGRSYREDRYDEKE